MIEITKNLRSTLNHMLDPAMIIDVEGSIVEINDRLAQVTGIKKDELERKSILQTDFISSKSRVFLFKKCLKSTQKSDLDSFEVEGKKKNGHKLFFELMMQDIKYSKKVVKLFVFHDITARNIREIALRDSDERYQRLCEDAKILILTTDLKGNICFANKIAETYGLIIKGSIEKNIADFVSIKNRSKFVSIHLNVVSGRKVHEEVEIITPNGLFVVDYYSSPIRKDDRITGCQISMIDITDKKQIMKKYENYSDSALELKNAYSNLGI